MRFVKCSFVLLIVFHLACLAAAAEQSKTDQAKALLDQMRKKDVGVWDASVQLEKLGPEAAPAVEEQLDSLSPRYRMAAARALCRIGNIHRGVRTLAEIIERDPESALARDASELLGEYGRSQAEGALVRLLDRTEKVDLKIALARSLWSAATTEEAWQKANTTLREVFEEAKGDDRKECALALAEINDFNDEVVATLEDLQAEPGHRGGEARALLDLKKLREMSGHNLRLDKNFRDPILSEIEMRLQTFHVEEPKSFEELRDAAARGMAAALDPFTNYYDADEYNSFRESMSGAYAGIGAKVGFLGDVNEPNERIFSVIRPIYSGPAYRAGLRSYDAIVKINGEPTQGKELKDLVKTLKGEKNTPVTVTIRRHSLPGEKEITIIRGVIRLKSAHHRMLPGSLGYIKLLHFGNDSVKEFTAALNDLEAKGAQALIIDLRNNPGGLLSAAVDISDMFLKNDKLIVRSVGRDSRIVPEERHLTTDPATHPDYPLIVLINGSSASASEIVSGALQDYKRAILVGERTYGKGSVQRLMELESDGKKSALKITVAKYYLPSGRSIQRTHTDRGGVKPDIQVKRESRLDSRDSGKFEEIRLDGGFDGYTDKYLDKERKLLEELSEFDGEDFSRYPGFDEWYDDLSVPISKGAARLLLRAWIRIKLSDERGTEFVVDIQDDDQLARAAAQAAIMLGKEEEFKQIEQFKDVLKKFKLEK